MVEMGTRGFKPFPKGDKVWLEATNLNKGYASSKVTPRREGPFKILEVLNPWNYQLKLPPTWKIHPIFHTTLLTPHKENNVYGKMKITPLAELIDKEAHYQIENIIAYQ